MSVIKIKLAILGHLPYSVNLSKIEKWKSCLFEIEKEIGQYPITEDSDIFHWSYSDINIEKHLPQRDEENILFAITNVPLEDNYFARRLTDNKICITYHDLVDVLQAHNIPLENLILRVLYAISILYRRTGGEIPSINEPYSFIHDETRGCLYDMCGIKTDIFYSLNKPQLCRSCIHDITYNENPKIDSNIIPKVQRELKKIRKERYYQILDFVKNKPVLTLILSTIAAVFSGILANYIWERWIQYIF